MDVVATFAVQNVELGEEGCLIMDVQTPRADKGFQRLRINIRGAVQGVGFRPFVYRLANQLALKGWVNNSPQGVFVEVEGSEGALKSFLAWVSEKKPPRSFIQSLESSYLDPAGYSDFEIRKSDTNGTRSALVLPDIATCPDCLADIWDPTNRRFRYPFTNCTNCGPRYSIIESVPYDRANTTMKAFTMCADCQHEFDEPEDRRFHAQPNACPVCGPRLELWDADGENISSFDAALVAAAQLLREGKIVAVKGLGGFHLMADARNDDAIRELRRRKHREEKPLAMMFPTLADIEEYCVVSEVERRLLISPETPIVLLKKTKTENLLPAVLAPRNPYLGAMLPYTPLHHLLMHEIGFPIVATSGNVSDEPICIGEHEALKRLRGIADVFLVHDRPIRRHVDDSIVREMMGREMMIRRARGFAPLPVQINTDTRPTLAVGGHLKNAIAFSLGSNIFISQHIGDLETQQAFYAFCSTVESTKNLYGAAPEAVAHDRHPDYVSTVWARDLGIQRLAVQHHHAHVLSCMAENDLSPPVLGIAWDGTGYGMDGTIWGGEFLRVNDAGFERAAHLRTFRLPGGDAAIKEPRRTALGVLFEVFGERAFEMRDLPPVNAFTQNELAVTKSMLARGINAPLTSSAGRLFDAVAALTGLSELIRFEGQAAMELEFAIDAAESGVYDFAISDGNPAVIDWGPLIESIIDDRLERVELAKISAKFHNTLVEMMVAIAMDVGEGSVALSGGCFQNKYLTERAVTQLRNEGFNVYWHQRVPTNDGGIALGQISAAAANVRREQKVERRALTICA